jgi:hypothetical protein
MPFFWDMALRHISDYPMTRRHILEKKKSFPTPPSTIQNSVTRFNLVGWVKVGVG